MNKPYNLCVIFLLLTACATDRSSQGVLLPSDYRTAFVHYATIDRKDGTIRDLYVEPDALAAVRAGQSFPDGAILVIDGFYAQIDSSGAYLRDTNGHLLPAEPFDRVHLAEKRSGWTEADFLSEARAGRWNYASYHAESGERFDEDLTACFNCHNGTPQTDFVYTYTLLTAYARTGEVQYFYCDLAGRVAC